MNLAYQRRFGFPFIIAVRGQRDRAAVLAALTRRFDSPPDAERQAAIAEVVKIAGFRLSALIDDDAASEPGRTGEAGL
jgi:2-oxo-4-hydroxy-4-carboxy-5-ureidoimidazoline decarboxylase